MMKRFKKMLSALCIIVLLVSSIVTVFANGDPEAEMPAVQEPAAEVNATDNTETAAAPAAVEEAPAQETTPATVEEAPTQETAPVTVKEAPTQENAPATAEEAPAQDTAPATVEEAPAQETAPATVEEAPAQDTASATVEEAPAQDTAAATVEEALAQENVPETVEETPAQNDASAAETDPAQEDAANLNAAPVQEDTAPAIENSQNSEESVATEENTSIEEIDELVNDPANYSEDELTELEDNGGYIDPEYVAEHMPEITPEMKYENITEMKIGSSISGSAGAEEILYYIKATQTQHIALVLQANGNIQVRINERAVNFTENEDGTKSYEMKVQYDNTYIIGISGQGNFHLSAEARIVEEPEEEIEEEIEEETNITDDQTGEGEETGEVVGGTETEENVEANVSEETGDTESTDNQDSKEVTGKETDKTEQTEVENTGNTQAVNGGTVENTAEENTESAGDNIEEEPAIITWVTAAVNEEGTITVYANANIELDNQIVWQTRTADSNEWKKAGYGMKLTVEVTEENADNFFRFRLVDGSFSPEHQIHANVKEEATEEEVAEEETENTTEEISEEAETAEEAETEERTEIPEDLGEAEETAETEKIEEVTDPEENNDTDEAEVSEETTEMSEETENTAEETDETLAEASEEADDETEVNEETDNEEEEAEDAESEEETAEDAETESEEEETDTVEEETEEAEEDKEEEETESLTEEQLIELGYYKMLVSNEDGIDIYDSTEEGAAVIGHADFESELWIKATENEEWAEIYREEETKQFIKLEKPTPTELTEEQLIELGYRKVQILNQNGTNIYDNTTEEATVIDTAETGTELWIRDAETEGWAEIYTNEEINKFLKVAEIEKQPPTDEEMLAMGYIKAVVAYDIGANAYDSLYGGNAIEHLDADTTLWIKLIEDADYAEIYNDDPDMASRYIALVDVIAILKPENMEQLPTRELVIHSSVEGMEILYYGTMIRYDTELINFLDDDNYTIQWKYSIDGENFVDIEGANELSYEFELDEENIEYFWKISIILQTAEQ